MSKTIRQCVAQYNESRELIQIGAYQKGSDPRVDQAVMIHPHIDEFTQQDFREVIPYPRCVEELKGLATVLIQDAQKRVQDLQQQQQAAVTQARPMVQNNVSVPSSKPQVQVSPNLQQPQNGGNSAFQRVK